MPAEKTHDHASHSHAHVSVTTETDSARLWIALGLIVSFMTVEVVVGLVVHSLALIADAAHMLTDAGALGMSIAVIQLMARPATGNLTFGLKRTEILSAQANGYTLLALSAWIIVEGVTRIVSPPRPGGLAILAVALVGIAVNLLATHQLSQANRESMNIQGSFQHLLSDLAAFIFTAIAGSVIITTGFDRADGIASLIIAAIMIRAAFGLLRDSGRVLLEIAPEGIDVTALGKALAEHPHVANIHDLHVWTVASGFPSLSAHVLVRPGDDCHAIRRELERLIETQFNIDHTTLQVDHVSTEKLLMIGESDGHEGQAE